MKIDLAPMLIGKTDRIAFSFVWEEASDYFPSVAFEKPVSVEGEVTAASGCMFLTFRVGISYRTVCARCLKELHRSLSLSDSRDVADSGRSEEAVPEDAVPVIRSAISLDEPVAELLFLELPSRDLCSEDCRGHCPQCGKDLNEGSCGCRREPDPRLAVLKRYLEEENESN